MAELQITITTITENDYDEVAVTEKVAVATIDEAVLPVTHSEPDSVSDATIKTNFKAELTEIGYTWDTEI